MSGQNSRKLPPLSPKGANTNDSDIPRRPRKKKRQTHVTTEDENATNSEAGGEHGSLSRGEDEQVQANTRQKRGKKKPKQPTDGQESTSDARPKTKKKKRVCMPTCLIN